MKAILILFSLFLITACSEDKTPEVKSSETLSHYINESNITINFAKPGELNSDQISRMRTLPGGKYEIILDKSHWEQRSECERKVLLEDLKSRTGSFGIFTASESLDEQYKIRCR